MTVITGTAWTPLAPVAHRTAVASADGTTRPAANNAAWLVNAQGRSGARGWASARVFVQTTGSPTACTLRSYVRCGGSSGQVASGDVVTLNGTPNFDAAFDVTVNGDDLLVYVETLSGGSSPTVSVSVSWR